MPPTKIMRSEERGCLLKSTDEPLVEASEAVGTGAETVTCLFCNEAGSADALVICEHFRECGGAAHGPCAKLVALPKVWTCPTCKQAAAAPEPPAPDIELMQPALCSGDPAVPTCYVCNGDDPYGLMICDAFESCGGAKHAKCAGMVAAPSKWRCEPCQGMPRQKPGEKKVWITEKERWEAENQMSDDMKKITAGGCCFVGLFYCTVQ